MRNLERLHLVAHPLSRDRRSLQVLRGQDREQLLAAVAVDGVSAPALVGERAGDGAEHLVAGQVAGGVVVGLEAVDVEQDHREAVPVALGTAGEHREVLVLAEPVAQPGQVVPAGIRRSSTRVQALELRLLGSQATVERGHPLGGDEPCLEVGALEASWSGSRPRRPPSP